jgi:hypothetical protein
MEALAEWVVGRNIAYTATAGIVLAVAAVAMQWVRVRRG